MWLLYYLYNGWLLLLVQCCYFPVPATSVPRIRRVTRGADRWLAAWGLKAGLSTSLVVLQMLGGLVASELGLHVSLMHALLVRYSVVDASLVATCCCAAFMYNYLYGFVTLWETRRMVPRGAAPSLSLAAWLAEATSWVTIMRVVKLPGVTKTTLERMDVYHPTMGEKKELAPVLVFVHGGAWMGGSKDRLAHFVETFVARGGVAVSLSYRLAPKHAFPAHIRDVNAGLDAVHRCIARYGGDPRLVFLCGGSAGGHLASLAALSTLEEHAHQPHVKVRGVVPIYGVYDWGVGGVSRDAQSDRRFQRFLSALVLKREHMSQPNMYKHASPIHWVMQGDSPLPPFLVFHGNADNLAPVGEARIFVDKLRERRARVTYCPMAIAHHSFMLLPGLRSLAMEEAISNFVWAEAARIKSAGA